MSGSLKLEGKILKLAEKVLFKVCKILAKAKIPYVLEGGTLLGIVRDNKLLPWDNDVDITIIDDYLERLIKTRKLIWLAGFRTRIRFHDKDIGPFKKGQVRMIKVQTRKFFFIKNFNLLDIFIKTKKDGKYYWIVGRKNTVLKSVDAHFYEKHTTVKFKENNLSIPYNYKEYLTCRYGDWKKTVKEWDFQRDDKAIVSKEIDV